MLSIISELLAPGTPMLLKEPVKRVEISVPEIPET
jgi:hypothetical protein